MLRKIKKKFIMVSMISFTIVMIILALAINVWNYTLAYSRLDDSMKEILNFEKERYSASNMESSDFTFPQDSTQGMHPEFPTEIDPEANASTRFFTVLYDEKTGKYNVHRDYINSMEEDACLAYAKEVQARSQKEGIKGNYRFIMEKSGDVTYFVFLNAAVDLHIIKTLAWVSLLVLLASLFLVFLLIIFLSDSAVKPFVENMEKQKRFITDASHEMKTPLTSISTSADILSMEYEENEWIDNIHHQTRHLSDLVQKLVTLSRLDENIAMKDVEEFCISEAVWEIAGSFQNLAAAKEKKMEIRIEENLFYTGNLSSIQQLSSILLENAVKYCDIHGTILCSLEKKRGKIRLSVDNPCHNHKIKDPDRLFDRFYRPDESRNSDCGGFGIGLSIARSIVEKHGGKIRAICSDSDHITFLVLL